MLLQIKLLVVMISRQDKGKILVLGGSSRIGSLMRESWKLKSTKDVIWHYRNKSAHKRDIFLKNEIYFDLDNYSSAVVNELGNIDTVLCLAGISSGTQSELHLNTELAEAGLKLSEDLNAKRFYYASSIAVYGYGEKLTELDSPKPVSEYGQSKLDAEIFLKQSESQVSVISLRMANALFADSITRQLVLPSQDNLINLDFFPNGKTLCRSYIDSNSLCNILDLLSKVDFPSFSVLNIASIEAMYADHLLKKLKVPWLKNYRSNWEGQKITLSTELLQEVVKGSSFRDLWSKSISSWVGAK